MSKVTLLPFMKLLSIIVLHDCIATKAGKARLKLKTALGNSHCIIKKRNRNFHYK